MTDIPAPTVWPALRYDDAPTAVRFLVDVLGFTETLVVPGPEGSIAHAELRWPEGGAVMLGSTGHPADGVHDAMKPGSSAVYVVSDHVDAIHAKAVAAGAAITAELHETDFGSHTFSLRDTGGNAGIIGTRRTVSGPGTACRVTVAGLLRVSEETGYESLKTSCRHHPP